MHWSEPRGGWGLRGHLLLVDGLGGHIAHLASLRRAKHGIILAGMAMTRRERTAGGGRPPRGEAGARAGAGYGGATGGTR